MIRYFCIHHADGRPVRSAELARYLERMAADGDGELNVLAAGSFAALLWTSTSALRPLAAHRPGLTAVGDVRLDNRADVARLAAADPACSDLELVLAAFAARGEACIPGLLGDFAFVVCDHRLRRIVAARDAFGVRALYLRGESNDVCFASAAALLGETGAYDREYLADYLVSGVGRGDRTIWSGVRAVPAGSVVAVASGTVRARRYWSAEAFRPASACDERAACDEFRVLFEDAVRQRAACDAPVWAQLSGGLDSSAIACTVARLAARGDLPSGLAGTVTIVDSLGEGDERRYVDAVLDAVPVGNARIADCWAWQDDGAEPPTTDEPRPFYPFFSRDRRMASAVRAGGGRVLLSGLGSDHYLHGNLSFIADLVARGRLAAAARSASAWAIAHRQSFWRMALRSGVHPLLPQWLKLRLAQPWQVVPDWLDAAFVRETDAASRLPLMRQLTGRRGQQFQRERGDELASIAAWIDRGVFEHGFEMRYPFLHRPLVEHALRLPVAMILRPLAHKWVLREAMRGVLPELVRSRTGKGGIDARILWSINREAARLGLLLRTPILEELGCIRGGALRRAVEAARCGHAPNLVLLLCALSLETWLAVRAGRWVPAPAVSSAA